MRNEEGGERLQTETPGLSSILDLVKKNTSLSEVFQRRRRDLNP